MIERVFLRLAERSIARPRPAIVVPVLLVLAALPGLWRLELRTDGHALVPPGDPAVRFDGEVRAHFGLRDPIVVFLETSHPDGIYNPATLRRLQTLTDALAAIPGVDPDHVTSLATERRDRVVPGTVTFRSFLDPLPDTPELVERLRGDVEAAGILDGTLVGAGARGATILIGVPGRAEAGSAASFYGARRSLYDRIVATAERSAGGGDRVLVVGAPAAEVLLGRHLLEDLALLVPLALAVIAAVIWLGCRRPWGVALGLGEVGACLLWTFGLMGWLGVPVYLTTAVLPVILTTIGLADEIHVFWRYQRLLERGEPHRRTVRETMRQMTPPLVITSLTTTVGFLSFLTSPIAPVRAFGAFAAAGILFCMLWSLTVIPAALAVVAPEKMRRPAAGAARRWPARLSAWLARRRRAVLAVLALATLGLGAGAARVEVQDSWIDGFAPGSAFRRATAAVETRLHGTHVLLAHLTFEADFDPGKLRLRPGRVGPLLDPELLRAVGRFEDFLRRRPEVGGVLGPHSHLSAVHYLWLARRQGARAVPEDPRRVQMTLSRFDGVRGERRRREVIDDELRRAVVSIFLPSANYRDTAGLMRAVRDYEAKHLAQHSVRVDFAGDVAVSQAMIPAIVETQVGSLLLALLGAFAALSLLYRSPATGLLAVAPASIAVLWVFGAMGWLGVPLGVATSMFCAITLGIGVDYAIHFLDRVRRARAEGATPVGRALEEAGPAIAFDCLAIVLGFGLLGFSQVPANARLGLLVALALVAGCLLSLVGLGAWLSRDRGS